MSSRAARLRNVEKDACRNNQDHAVRCVEIHTEKDTVSKISGLKTSGVSGYVWEGGDTDPHSECWGEGGELVSNESNG